MKKRSSFLIILLISLTFIIGIDMVRADCFKVTTTKELYYDTIDNWMRTGDTTYEEVDYSFCDSNSNSNNSNKTCYRVKTPIVSYTNIEPNGMVGSSKVEKVSDSYCNDISSESSNYCFDLTESNCKGGTDNYSCVWNEKYKFCNTDNLTYVSCGDAFDIPSGLPAIVSFVVNLLKIATPIVLVIVGIITLLKALAASTEDEIKKAQNSLVKKIITALLVFFVISIVQFVISRVADDSEKAGVTSCLKCFLNNDCESSMYYKTNIGGTYWCTPLDSSKDRFICKENKENSN